MLLGQFVDVEHALRILAGNRITEADRTMWSYPRRFVDPAERTKVSSVTIQYMTPGATLAVPSGAARPRLTFLGTGYLGATYAVCFAELGYEVLGYDVDAPKIAKLTGGEVPFHEPGL